MLDRQPKFLLPYKSTAAGLIFTILLGPLGLLYATFWGGFSMIILGVVIISSKLFFPTLLLWIICCIWSVGSIESHNKKIFQSAIQREQECANKLYAGSDAKTL